MDPTITVPDIMDGFTLNPSIRYRPNWYYPMALGQLDILRRANTYRPKIYSLPDEFNTPIPARETREFQLRLTPGSYIWGLAGKPVSSKRAGPLPEDPADILHEDHGLLHWHRFLGGLRLRPGLQRGAGDYGRLSEHDAPAPPEPTEAHRGTRTAGG